ncbi:MAG: hypothetical protein JWM68_2202 [Verrucomicrobiales bacterium]|nr:hypothetical protein [Verrucomicrobiales bacterium]
MRFRFPALWLVAFSGVLIFSSSSRAAITVLRHYRLGDADSGAVAGVAATNSLDSQVSNGTNYLTIAGSPVYSADTGYFSSARSLQFSGTNFGTATVVSNLTDNFGVEAWVKTTVNAGSHFVVYNGNTASNGWGIVQNGSGNVWSVLFGGQTVFGSVPVTANQWTHLALVRSNGLATLYVNGAVRATDTNAPVAAGGALAVGAPPQDTSAETWQGWIDEVRIFTFVPGSIYSPGGSFNTTDLLHPYLPADPLRLDVAQQANQIALSWPTNRSAVAETVTNLSATNWTTLSNPVVTNGQFTLTNNTSDPSRFVRLRRVPCPVNPVQVPPVTINPNADGEESFIAGRGGLANDFNQGGYKVVQFVDGSVVNVFDASETIVKLACDPADPPPSFKWDIFRPPLLGGARVTTRGITGYCGPTMRIAENSLPSLVDTEAETDPFWRVRLTVTYQQAGQSPTNIVGWFRFQYQQTTTSLQVFTACQQCPGDAPCPTCNEENVRPGVDCNP